MQQPVVKKVCECTNTVDLIVPMNQWSEILGHEKTNELLARRKAGKKPEVRARRHCGNCRDCTVYRDWLKQFPVVPLGPTSSPLEPAPQTPDITCYEVYEVFLE